MYCVLLRVGVQSSNSEVVILFGFENKKKRSKLPFLFYNLLVFYLIYYHDKLFMLDLCVVLH
jgi:hypothetical protein